jgi:S1-C subfamily serine protease
VVRAAPWSPVARLLGANTRRPFVGFDHDKIAAGDASLFPGRRLRFAQPRPAGFLGVEGVARDRGVLVTKVLPGEAAARAGIRGGDVILALDRTAVHALGELLNAASARRPGSRAALTVLRHGARQTVAVTLGERPPA